MTWTKIDDRFFHHPKIVTLSDAGYRLYVNGLVWSAANLTDGYLPAAVLPLLLPSTEYVRTQRRAARDLVEAGLWTVVDGGWTIHDFADYQMTKAEVRERRAQAANRQQTYRNRWAGRRSGDIAETYDGDSGEIAETYDRDSATEIRAVTEKPAEVTPLLTLLPVPTRPVPDIEILNGSLLGDSGSAAESRPATSRASPKRRDLIFESVCAVAGIDWRELTETGRGPVNRAVSELRRVGATPASVTVRAVNYALRFESQPTPMALAKHWAQCANPPPNLDRRTVKSQLERFHLSEFLDVWSTE